MGDLYTKKKKTPDNFFLYLSFCNIPSALAVDTVACLRLSNIVILNDSFPACYPFPNSQSMKCAAQGTEGKCRLERLSHVLQCRRRRASISLKHQPLSAFTEDVLWQNGKHKTRESKGRDTAGLSVSKQFDISKVNARLPVGIWVSSEELEECPGVGELQIQKTSLSKLWFLSRDPNEVKAGNSLSSFFLFLLQSLQEHIKGISSSLTICCIVS